MMTGPHIFPFCRQSQIIGLREALSIIDGTPFLVADGDAFPSLLKTLIRSRIAEISEESA